MEKEFLNAKQAKEVMNTTGISKFRNLIFKRIREEAEDGFCSLIHTFGDEFEGIDLGIVNTIKNELIDMGYTVDIDDGTLRIKWN